MTSSQTNDPRNISSASSPADQLAQRFAQRFDELRKQLRKADPTLIAARSAAEIASETPESGRLLMQLWGRPVFVAYPDYVV